MGHRPDQVWMTGMLRTVFECLVLHDLPSTPLCLLTFDMSNALQQPPQSGQHDVTLSRGWSEQSLGGLSNPLWVFSIVFFKDVIQSPGFIVPK